MKDIAPCDAAQSSDRIEKQIVLKAPRARVWQALVDAEAFGAWFGVALDGKKFAAGERIQGRITHPGYEHLVFEAWVERIEPERLFSYRWHPYAVDAAVDYSKEPRTLVVFELEDVAGGTLLRVVESGFDAIPPERRLDAFRMNSAGWDAQLANVERYVAAS